MLTWRIQPRIRYSSTEWLLAGAEEQTQRRIARPSSTPIDGASATPRSGVGCTNYVNCGFSPCGMAPTGHVAEGGWPALLTLNNRETRVGAPLLRFCRGGYDAAEAMGL